MEDGGSPQWPLMLFIRGGQDQGGPFVRGSLIPQEVVCTMVPIGQCKIIMEGLESKCGMLNHQVLKFKSLASKTRRILVLKLL